MLLVELAALASGAALTEHMEVGGLDRVCQCVWKNLNE